MKKTSFLTVLFGLSLLINSCSRVGIKPTGAVTKQEKTISGFNALDVSSAISVYVNFSDTEEKIEIEANENIHPYIDIEKTGNELEIGLKPNINIRGNAVLRVYITTKNIKCYEASGSSAIFIREQANSDNIEIDLSGASTLNGEIACNNLNVEISGASTVDLMGQTNYATVECSGASGLKSYGLNIQNLNIDLSGASNAELTIQNTINIEASGASQLNYKGDASIKSIDLSGASRVSKRD